jgi:hypothetical protein
MNTISFQNKGLIDIRAVRTFGVSAKECSNPIGFFGTGLKYAIAISLRLGCKVTLYRGLERFDFKTTATEIRNSTFGIVTMNGEELGFTVDLGKTWEPWQAFRELYCNAIDEGGAVIEGPVEPAEDATTIIISGDRMYSAYIERDSIILRGEPKWKTDVADVYDRPTEFAYYRGIKVGKLPAPSTLTFNIKRPLTLTEDRTVKEEIYYRVAVRDAIAHTEHRDLAVRFLKAPSECYEAKLDMETWQEPSAAFMEAIEFLTFRDCTNQSALRVYKKFKKCELLPDSTPLNVIEQQQLDRSIRFCEWMGHKVRDYEIVVTTDLKDRVWGRAYEGRIYLNRRAFMVGTKTVAGTLLEEYLHLKHNYEDESRSLQNFLLDALMSMAELARGEPV